MTDKNPPGKDELRKRLSSEQYQVTQEAATKAPFTGIYVDCKDDGIYRCVCCSLPLFASDGRRYRLGAVADFNLTRTLQEIRRFDRQTASVIEANLDATFVRSYPEDAPNLFFVDIQPDQRNGFVRLVDTDVTFYPVVRARVRQMPSGAASVPEGSSGGEPPWLSSAARMNSSVTRTEWLAFWKKTEP